MKAKPFIKWVGGKGQLIEQLDAQLPADFDNWEIDKAGYRFMLSNSDCKGKNENDNFFDVLYGAYHRTRIYEQNGTPNIVCKNHHL